mmetsp:Transcript_32288/g.91962  ORF Transcript_32288/g.91962 Transcript_32288/m.91962 type:complete len:310 (-) Transcript_32288:538-1467(-)
MSACFIIAQAKSKRMRQPPERSATGLSCISLGKPTFSNACSAEIFASACCAMSRCTKPMAVLSRIFIFPKSASDTCTHLMSFGMPTTRPACNSFISVVLPQPLCPTTPYLLFRRNSNTVSFNNKCPPPYIRRRSSTYSSLSPTTSSPSLSSSSVSEFSPKTPFATARDTWTTASSPIVPGVYRDVTVCNFSFNSPNKPRLANASTAIDAEIVSQKLRVASPPSPAASQEPGGKTAWKLAFANASRSRRSSCAAAACSTTTAPAASAAASSWATASVSRASNDASCFGAAPFSVAFGTSPRGEGSGRAAR